MKIKVWSETGLELFRKSEDDSGYDLRSTRDYTIMPGEQQLVETGIHIDLTNVYYSNSISIEAQVRPRSSLAANHGIMVVNSPGTIDRSYRGELKVILLNTSKKEFLINKGDRISQLVFCPVFKIDKIEYISEKDYKSVETNRGEGGFGSTGKN